MSLPKEITFITGNKNKLAEVNAILSSPYISPSGGTEPRPLPVKITSLAADLPELQGSIESISREKAILATQTAKGPVLVEDTCLVFDALSEKHELPGPYIKWFVESVGVASLHRLLAGFENKAGRAVCTFAYCPGPDAVAAAVAAGKAAESCVLLFQGITNGQIVESRGPTNFGWDSCFEYEGKTYAEMEKAEKNEVSHRGKALRKFRAWLDEQAQKTAD